MAEKREFPRKKRRLTVEFNWAKASCTGFTYDISPSGIFVRSIRIPRVGSRLTIKLILPDDRQLSIAGTVVRSYRVPPTLARLIPSGFSLKLMGRPPEDYLRFLASI